MFEKEAEGYTLNKLVGLEDFDNYQSAYDRYENGVQDAFKDGAEFGYNKANEWHYVKDKLPEEDVYVYLLCKKDDYPVVARRHIFYGETEWKWDCKWGSGFQLKADNEKIIAWKEIVLPNIKEN